ncbi:glycosyltransferase family 2 protein [Actinocorallia sp. API 0066]|uniref:glycosyltransferase family 2 protein n=1 Tax=Actinocorallia sp. API 0066 TaxID=2896846 RepID=UPI001E5A18F5|nr:glycosyltransferase family A protein [Actinocorallia sp. API 0066]MCD0448264.1 glycosyltransferase family 2 protein [Actinocorallia sp. API 0066]
MTTAPSEAVMTHPSVGVVIPTLNRPELLRETLASVKEQVYPGVVKAIVVYDRGEPDLSLASDDPLRPVEVLVNTRTPGAAGARNSGLLAAGTEYVGFCDDTDLFLPGKISAQVDVLGREPHTEVVCCGLRLFGRSIEDTERFIPRPRVTHEDLLTGHNPNLHPSALLLRRSSGLLFDEEIPGSYGEDYEFVLRAAGRAPIRQIPFVGLGLRWHEGSYFSVLDNAPLISQAAQWMLAKYEFPCGGYAHWAGKVAFAEAVSAHRGTALKWIWRTMVARPLDPRALLALAVTVGVPAAFIMKNLDRIGRGV